MKVVDQPQAQLVELEQTQQQRLNAPAHREQRTELEEGEEALVIPIDRAIKLYTLEASTATP